MVAEPNTGTPGIAQVWLAALGARLRGEGYQVVLNAPVDIFPSLDVVNPEVPMMRDRLTAGLRADGAWWYWFSFGEPVSDAIDLGEAVRRIGKVLGRPP